MPATIIPGFLYLGSYDTASRQELLKAMNMTHILNVSPPRSAAPAVPSACAAIDSIDRPRAARRRGVSALLLLLLQTVPNCQPLYKNTFIYHTVSTPQPDLGECFSFLGEAAGAGGRAGRRVWVLWWVCPAWERLRAHRATHRALALICTVCRSSERAAAAGAGALHDRQNQVRCRPAGQPQQRSAVSTPE